MTSDKAETIVIGDYIKHSDDGYTLYNLSLYLTTILKIIRMMLQYWWDVSSLMASRTVFCIFYSV